MQPGFKSSEFIVSILSIVTPAVLHALVGSTDPTIALVGGVIAAIYTACRTLLKHQDNDFSSVLPPSAPLPVVAPEPLAAPSMGPVVDSQPAK